MGMIQTAFSSVGQRFLELIVTNAMGPIIIGAKTKNETAFRRRDQWSTRLLNRAEEHNIKSRKSGRWDVSAEKAKPKATMRTQRERHPGGRREMRRLTLVDDTS